MTHVRVPVRNPKLEYRNSKQARNLKAQNSRRYDLEARTLQFAHDVRAFVKKLPKGAGNFEDSRQLIRSSGSVGANYIEANEALSKKDFTLRIKIARKEAKESGYWLQLLDTGTSTAFECDRQRLIQEAHELMMIFGAILQKVRE